MVRAITINSVLFPVTPSNLLRAPRVATDFGSVPGQHDSLEQGAWRCLGYRYMASCQFHANCESERYRRVGAFHLAGPAKSPGHDGHDFQGESMILSNQGSESLLIHSDEFAGGLGDYGRQSG